MREITENYKEKGLNLAKNKLFKNTSWMIYGNGLKVVFQSIYFVIIAKILGINGFGAFMGTLAYVSIFAPFSGIGSGNILVKNVARCPTLFNISFGTAILKTLFSTVILGFLLLIGDILVLPRDIHMMVLINIALSELCLARLTDISSQAFQAYEKLSMTANIQILISFIRFLASVYMYFFIESPNISIWSYLYLLGSLITAILSISFVVKMLGKPIFRLKQIYKELKEGFYFSISLSAQNIYNDIDKTMLTKLSTLEASGIYSAAYKIIDLSFTPVRSLLNATYSSFFREGSKGIHGSFELAKKVIIVPVIYSVLLTIVLIFSAPLLPLLLGDSYKTSIHAIQLLAILPLFRSFHYFAADTLTGAGYQYYRSFIQLFIALLNVILNLWLIKKYSWFGASISSLISDFILAILLWTLIFIFLKKEKEL